MEDWKSIRIQEDDLLLVPIDMTYKQDIFTEFTPEVTRYMSPAPAKEMEETERFIQYSQAAMAEGHEILLILLDANTGEFYGCVGLHDIHQRIPAFGLWIKTSAHGRHIGRRAIHMLYHYVQKHYQFDAIKYPVDRDNIPSRRIPESLGGTVVAAYDQINQQGNTLHLVEYHIPFHSELT